MLAALLSLFAGFGLVGFGSSKSNERTADLQSSPTITETDPQEEVADTPATAETGSEEENSPEEIAEPVIEEPVVPVVEPAVEPAIEPAVEPVVEPVSEPVVATDDTGTGTGADTGGAAPVVSEAPADEPATADPVVADETSDPEPDTPVSIPVSVADPADEDTSGSGGSGETRDEVVVVVTPEPTPEPEPEPEPVTPVADTGDSTGDTGGDTGGETPAEETVAEVTPPADTGSTNDTGGDTYGAGTGTDTGTDTGGSDTGGSGTGGSSGEAYETPVEEPVAVLPDVGTPDDDTGGDTGSDTGTDTGGGDVTGDGGDAEVIGAGSETLSLASGATLTTTAMAGRVTRLDFEEDDVAQVEILTKPDLGNVTVNPDNSLAVVLTHVDNAVDTEASFDIRVTLADGSTADHSISLDVTPGLQDDGWGLGDFYMLDEDDNGDLIIETLETTRVVHVSNSEEALSLADIGVIEGVDHGENWDAWRKLLVDNNYGTTPETALKEDAADQLWRALHNGNQDQSPQANHMLFESGYSYDVFIPYGGASPLTPAYYGAYGEGERPIIEAEIRANANANNIIFDGLQFEGSLDILGGENVMLHDVTTTKTELVFLNINGLTIKDSNIYDVYYEESPSGEDTWFQHADRVSGMYVAKSDGVLLDNLYVDHNGWADGYDYNLSTEYGQPPSMFSHNIYLQTTNLDVTMRDNIIMQGASSGVQMRPGGFIEDNLFLDNNGAVMFAGGDDAANYTLFTGNVVTSAGHKEAAASIGELSYGITNQGFLSTLTENIVAHLADPNNPDEFAEKTNGQHAIQHVGEHEAFYDDSIVYNWEASVSAPKYGLADDRGLDGLDTEVLDQTTIQIFTAQLLGQETATITDLSNYLRQEANGTLDDVVDADLINAFFMVNFGLGTELRTDAETLRFIPNQLGDGVRWDNRLNWSTDDLPGTQDGDRVDLADNWVEYAGAGTTTITDLDFGNGGKLNITSGKLTIDDHITVEQDGAAFSLDNSGQLWINGYTDQDLLTINADGGRLANTGLLTGKTDLQISDDAQVLLGTDDADYVLGDGSRLAIHGGDAKVGFDGDGGTGALLMSDSAALEFYAEDGALGEITEFYSGGLFSGDIESGVNLGDAVLRIDITELSGLGGFSHDLISVDEIIGTFGSVEIDGLDTSQNAVLTVNYETDKVTLELGVPGVGTGDFALETVGVETDSDSSTALLDALTNGHGIYDDDRPEDIPAENDDDPFVI